MKSISVGIPERSLVSENFLENCIKHEPPRMLTAGFLATPHGPCIMQRLTIQCGLRCRIESRVVSGISAPTILS